MTRLERRSRIKYLQAKLWLRRHDKVKEGQMRTAIICTIGFHACVMGALVILTQAYP